MTLQPLLKAEPETRSIFVHTFGCQMNEYDSLRVVRLLAPLGYRSTTDISEADVVFINTCSVREKAEQKVYSFLGRLKPLKQRRPHMKIIIAGCVAQQLGEKLLARFEYVDLVLGTRAVSSITGLLEHAIETGARLVHLPEIDPGDELEFHCGLNGVQTHVVAPVTIMQGCDNFCSYCIVPFVRGRERSRPADAIIREISLLVESGAREVLLLGQNVNSYGRGLETDISFVGLLRRIQDETDLARLRFTTSHPKDLTDELIRCFAELPCLCAHLHLPVQAGSDEILRRMNRGYSRSRYLERIDRLREICPDIGLSSDVMVGFPGESEEQFQDTMNLLKTVQFDSLFSFKYSDRPDTRASRFPDKVPEDVKARRLTELQNLQAEITLRKNLDEIGRIRDVLVEGTSKASKEQSTGRTQQNRVVNFDNPDVPAGRIVRLRITAAFAHSLLGEAI
ncbi:MAG: tRNA (N6-isopentenyl adenosine(37)-C2)-methylthiotransferase MiaB [Syntrophobacteraceae bacterium]|nr:tRNA (N6-isopentenyl adenosine(37)-C2)-methylthiotransferase MiaB [Syntrophobacteraceae bacterium]